MPICNFCKQNMKEDDETVYVDHGVMDSDDSVELWDGIARYHYPCFIKREELFLELLKKTEKP